MQKHKQDDGCLGHLGCSRYKVNGAVLNENEKSCGKERKTKKTRGKKSDNHSQIPTSCENQASGVKATTKKKKKKLLRHNIRGEKKKAEKSEL